MKKLEPEELDRAIFGPLPIWANTIGQCISTLNDNNNEHVSRAIDFVALELEVATYGDQHHAELLRELDKRVLGGIGNISPIFNRDYIAQHNFIIDESGDLNARDLAALRSAIYDTGIAEMPEYQAVIGKTHVGPV